MKIQVNSDNTIAVDANLISFVEQEVDRVLGRFADRLTRVEVHLSDINSIRSSGQPDKRCLIEARPKGARPLAADATEPKLAMAVGAAAGKLRRALTTFFAKAARDAKALPAGKAVRRGR
jgi:hypothetical protein